MSGVDWAVRAYKGITYIPKMRLLLLYILAAIMILTAEASRNRPSGGVAQSAEGRSPAMSFAPRARLAARRGVAGSPKDRLKPRKRRKLLGSGHRVSGVCRV